MSHKDRSNWTRLLTLMATMAWVTSGCTIIIQAPIVCPEGSTLQNGRCMGQVVGGGGSAAASNVSGGAGSVDVAAQIRGFTDGGSSAWDEQVSKVLLANFDKDSSGAIDSSPEIDGVPCEVWTAMDEATRRDDEVPVMALYGFAPGYLWAGDALGFDAATREQATMRMQGCGLSY